MKFHISELRRMMWKHDCSWQLCTQLRQLWNLSLKKIQAWTGIERMTSATPVQSSTNWAIKPIGSWPLFPSWLTSVGRALHRYRRGVGLNPVQAWIFFRLSFHSCVSCLHNCEDQSSLHEIALVKIRKWPPRNCILCWLYYVPGSYHAWYIYGFVNLRVIFNNTRRIKSFFPYKDHINCSQRSKVVYRANCWDCDSFYVGKTKRRLHDRKTEHFKALSQGCHASALADHVISTGHNIKWDHFDILTIGNSVWLKVDCKTVVFGSRKAL